MAAYGEIPMAAVTVIGDALSTAHGVVEPDAKSR